MLFHVLSFYKTLFFFLIFAVVCLTEAQADNTTRHAVPGELLIKYRADALNISSSAIRQKMHSKTHFHHLAIEHWQLASNSNLDVVINQLKQDPNVEWVEPNYRRYARTSYSVAETNAQVSANARLKQLNLHRLWQQAVTRFQPVKIAVIDDAFAIDHEDLAGNIQLAYNALDGSDNARPDQCIDESVGLTFEGHGTNILGVLGAVSDNGIGIDGASNNAHIYPIRISCNYTVAAELAAIEWAIANDVDIISLSYGGPMFSELERQALQQAFAKEILIVVAAGNYDIDNDRIADYPSGLDLPNIIAVAATNTQNNLSSWSQWGQTSVDIAAPGEMIGSTLVSSAVDSYQEYIANASGTSFSAPLVAGVLASLMQRDPTHELQGSVFRASAALLSGAQPLVNTVKARLATDGYVDAMRAYEKLAVIEPVLVIKSIVIDDNEFGNMNSEVDPGEVVKLRLILQNKGGDASDIRAVLSAEGSAEVLPELHAVLGDNGSIAGYDAITHTQRYAEKELVFDMDFSAIDNHQEVLFRLDLQGSYSNGVNSFEYSRYFRINISSLRNGETVSAELIWTSDNQQNELQLYHIQVPENRSQLVISLLTEEVGGGNKLDILTSYGVIPQFDYFYYTDYETTPDVIAKGVTVGRQGEDSPVETITLDNPKAGIYYIAVVVDENYVATRINYSINAEFTKKSKKSSSAAGCSIGQSNAFDPMLNLLCLIVLMRLCVARKSRL